MLRLEEVLRLASGFSEESVCEYDEKRAPAHLLSHHESLVALLEANQFRYAGKSTGKSSNWYGHYHKETPFYFGLSRKRKNPRNSRVSDDHQRETIRR